MLFPLSPRLKNQEVSFYTYGLPPFSSQKPNQTKQTKKQTRRRKSGSKAERMAATFVLKKTGWQKLPESERK